MPFVGARDPEAIEIAVAPLSGDDFDLADVTSCEFTVAGPPTVGTISSWQWDVVGLEGGKLIVRHRFSSDGLEVTSPGFYTVSGWLVSSATRRRIKQTQFNFSKYP